MASGLFSFLSWRERPWLIGIFAILLAGIIHFLIGVWLKEIPLGSFFTFGPKNRNVSIHFLRTPPKRIPLPPQKTTNPPIVVPPFISPEVFPPKGSSPQVPPHRTPQHPKTSQHTQRPAVPKTTPPKEHLSPSPPSSQTPNLPPTIPNPSALKEGTHTGPTSAPEGGSPSHPIDLFPKDFLKKSITPSENGSSHSIPSSSHNSSFNDFTQALAQSGQVEKKLMRIIPEKQGGFKIESSNVIGHIKPDCTIAFSNRSPIGFQKGGTFTFDTTDMIMRAKGQHPYAAEIRKVLEETKDFREDLCKKVRNEKLQQAQAITDQELKQIWQKSLPMAQKRRSLFHYWVERGDEPGPSLAASIRKQIEVFIRQNLPANGEDAYTEDELSQMNEELKKQEFAISFHPYPRKKATAKKTTPESNPKDDEPSKTSESSEPQEKSNEKQPQAEE